MKKKKLPFISIIMNCHNGEKYLKNSIKSVLNQSYKFWELIFFDNQSKDKSKKIVLSFKDKRIKYFSSKKFNSLYEARNLAISKTKGEYVCFLDVDDWWTKTKLAKQVEIIKTNENIKFIYSNCYIFDQTSKKKKLHSIDKLPSGNITQNLLDDYKIGIVTVMINKKLLKKRKFNPKYNIIGDFDLFVNLSIKENFFCIQQPLAYYRLHKSNFSKNIKIYSDELTYWISSNSRFLKKKNYSLNKIDFYNKKLKVKKFFYLGP
jgi:glycosyltransferase involved in cell wall biosynthesis